MFSLLLKDLNFSLLFVKFLGKFKKKTGGGGGGGGGGVNEELKFL